jgi:iron-sulfur cluster repair protein YtfE (RIC family)
MQASLQRANSGHVEITVSRTALDRAIQIPLTSGERPPPAMDHAAVGPPGDAMDCGCEHPGRDSSALEIIAHVVRVHHHSLRRQVIGIRKLFAETLSPQGTSRNRWQIVADGFSELHGELARCLRWERFVVFPAIAGAQSESDPMLLDLLRATSKSHARLLQMFWRLVHVVQTTLSLDRSNPAGDPLLSSLCALRDDFCQHLYEEECLLFPRLAAQRASPNDAQRETRHLAH